MGARGTLRHTACSCLIQDLNAISITTGKLMSTLDEISTLAFVLLKILVATAPKKKHGCASHEPLRALANQATENESTEWSASARNIASTGYVVQSAWLQ
jgi:hypothetical protein